METLVTNRLILMPYDIPLKENLIKPVRFVPSLLINQITYSSVCSWKFIVPWYVKMFPIFKTVFIFEIFCVAT